VTGAQPPVQDPGAAPGQTPGRHRKVGATVLYSVTCPDLADVGWFHLRGYGHMASDRHLADLLGDFVRTIAGDFPLEAVLAHLTERVLDVVPVTGAGVTLISAGVNPHTLAASDDRARHFEELQTTLNEGPCLAAWESGLAVAVPDLRLDDRFPVFATQALESGLGGVFTFPIRRGSRRIGALDLYCDRPGPLSEGSMVAAQTLADVAAAYLCSAQARTDDVTTTAVGLSLFDPVTGLPTRRILTDRLQQLCLRGARTGRSSAVFFVTLGRFDSTTRMQGQEMADELMAAVARRLVGMLRPGDTVAHLDDEQFIIVCEGLETPAHAAAFATRIESAMEGPFVVSGVEATVSAVAGIAFVDEHTSVAALLSRGVTGDHRRVESRTTTLARRDSRHERRLADNLASLERDLFGAAARGELYAHYQPIVAASDGGIVGVEALVRWLHPTRGLVSPTTLIPLAEHSSLMVEIGLWVLEESLAAGRSWQRLCRSGGLEMCVNVSAHQLRSPGYVQTVAEALRASRVDPHLLTLEVTESASVSASAIGILADLKSLGVKLALDDFGTGYSSLSDIARFPVDIIKIDRAFVAGLGELAPSAVIVGSVIDLAHGLGMTVVAEGVETEQQLHELARLGCDTYQGFYFAPPMSIATLDALAERPIRPNYRSLLAPPRWEPFAGSPGLDGVA